MILSRRFDRSICGTQFLRRPSSCRGLAAPGSRCGETGYLFCVSFTTKLRRRLERAGTTIPFFEPCHSALLPGHAGHRAQPSAAPSIIPRCAGTIPRRYGQTQASAQKEPETVAVVSAVPSPVNAPAMPAAPAAPTVPPRPSEEELLEIVGQYVENDTVQAHLNFWKDPYLRGYASANDSEVSVSTRRDDVLAPRPDEVLMPGEREQMILDQLQEAVLLRLRHPIGSSADRIYYLYCKLPEPRMSYISGDLRHKLLKVMGQAQRRNTVSLLRYFGMLGDVKACGFSLLPSEWNSAIHIASRHVGTVKEDHVETALGLWRDMEQSANLRGNEATFNILFDVATKAGNFTLAEMAFREMEHRNIWFNRFHHVSLIYFFGLKMDADGVRAAYREMVKSGEMVDHVALNCVISALLSCGEEDAATRVYERMKAFHPHFAKLPPKQYNTQKAITKILMMFARVGRTHPGLRPVLQGGARIEPDLQTYRVLIRHFALRVGRIDLVAQYLDEMRSFQIPVQGSIFLSLFKGFALHGSAASSPVTPPDWSQQRLFSVWEALLSALDNDTEGMYVDTWLVIWVLRAFENCGCRDMLADVYEELAGRWRLSEARAEYMAEYMYKTMKRLNLPTDGSAFAAKPLSIGRVKKT